MSTVLRALVLASLCLCALLPARAAAPALALKEGDRVVFLGDTLMEQEQYHGWIELMLTARFPAQGVTFRNLGWSADTPAGDSRFGLSLLQAGREPADEGWKNLVKQIEEARPTVVMLGYGMASSFDGDTGLTKFRADYRRLLDTIERTVPGVRFVFLSPIAHEALGAPWPAPAAHNDQLAAYARVIGELAGERKGAYVPLYDLTRARSGAKLTANGIHPTTAGYRALAETIEDALFGNPGPWRTSAQAEPLRQAILRKNEWFFHRSRPANMAYIFGFRKREQGKNAAEIVQFDEFIAAEEKRIEQLRALQPANVPEIPRRVGNKAAVFTPQPHPKFEVADGLEVTLWAENPLLNKPLQMNFDPQGRLWVVSSELYPQIEPGQAATDKIIVLEDTTGAGRADKATVFADGLLIPTGIEVGDGGAYVAQSTEVLHFKDTDGDGKADVRRAVLSGFGTEDTHHNLHTLRWGPDGRMTMIQSVYTRTDTETPHGVVRLKAGGTFRFDLRNEKMEILYRGLINGWGHQHDAYGESMMTDGAGFQGLSWGVPGATLLTLAPARRVIDSISPGRYPKFASIELVHSKLFPADWQGDAITLDFRAHRVVRFKIEDRGAGYVTKEMPDLIRTTADAFRPIDVRLGPDGALYVADWSNPIIQHGEVDFRDPRRDKAHGRIWRIAPKGAAPLKRIDFTKLANADLLDRLLSPNSYDQQQARRVLVERGSARVAADLDAWTKKQTSELGKLRALWMHQAFDRVPPALLNEALAAKDARVRAAAIRVLPEGGEIGPLEKLVADEHPRVRLAAVRALGSRSTARSAELALGVLAKPMDNFLDYAVWLTINELAEPWLAAVKNGSWKIEGREKQLEFALKAVEPTQASAVLGLLVGKQGGVPRDGSGPWIELIGSAGGAAELRLLFDQLLRNELNAESTSRAFAALGDAARLRSAKPSGDLGALTTLLVSANEKTRIAALQLGGAWKLRPLLPQVVAVTTKAGVSAAERTAAFAALRDIGGAGAIAELKKLAADEASPELRREAIVTLASLELPTAMPYVIAVLKATTDEVQSQTLWRSLLSIRGVSGRLTTELEKTELPREVARAGLRPAREGTQHQALVPVLLKSAGLSLSNVQLSGADMQQLAREALAKGDPKRGEMIYRRAELACVTCHAIGGAGGKLGPDMTSLGASAPPDYIVESLLYPNAKIKEGYHSASISTRDGRELSGMIAKESDTEIVLRTAANEDVSVATKDITRRTSVGSLMPAGLIDGLVPEERLDLIAFITQLGKPGEFDAAKGGVARAWRLYLVLSSNEHLGVERVVRGDFTLADWKPVLSLTSGTLAKGLLEAQHPNRNNNRGWFAATRVEAAQDGNATFTLSNPAGVKSLWVNGTLVKAGAQFTAPVKKGTNTLVLKLDDVAPQDVAVRSGDVTFSIE